MKQQNTGGKEYSLDIVSLDNRMKYDQSVNIKENNNQVVNIVSH